MAERDVFILAEQALAVQGMWDELSPDMDEWRTLGVYKAAVPVPDDAPLQDRLIAFSGRDPS